METHQQFFRLKVQNQNHLSDINADVLNAFFISLGSNTTKHLPTTNNYQKYLKTNLLRSIYFAPTTESKINDIMHSLRIKHMQVTIIFPLYH